MELLASTVLARMRSGGNEAMPGGSFGAEAQRESGGAEKNKPGNMPCLALRIAHEAAARVLASRGAAATPALPSASCLLMPPLSASQLTSIA